jgi:hypothetical protein
MQKEGLGVEYPADHSSYADDPVPDSTGDNTPGGVAVTPRHLARWRRSNGQVIVNEYRLKQGVKGVLNSSVEPTQGPALATDPVLGSHWASSQALAQWLEANTLGPSSVLPTQPDQERHQRPLQADDGDLQHEQHLANPLDHDRLLNEQRERLKQQAAFEDPTPKRRWNGYHPPREEVLRKRLERKKERRQDRNGARRRFRANLAEQRRHRCEE